MWDAGSRLQRRQGSRARPAPHCSSAGAGATVSSPSSSRETTRSPASSTRSRRRSPRCGSTTRGASTAKPGSVGPASAPCVSDPARSGWSTTSSASRPVRHTQLKAEGARSSSTWATSTHPPAGRRQREFSSSRRATRPEISAGSSPASRSRSGVVAGGLRGSDA